MMYLYGAGQPDYGYGKYKNKPTIFIVSKNGNWSYYQYCPHTQCIDADQPRAIKRCEKGSRGSPCYVMALKRRIVWKNGNKKLRIKKSLLKNPTNVALAIKQAGFYDGDITKLVGVDIETGQVNEDINISGEKDTKEKKITKTKDSDIVKELETLTKLYENGSLTKEEFDKAKEKLFKN